ncbi:putative Mammalian cell entry related domain protein [Candidatus Competibacter denitrificans Run_A_D11]|uniref:Mammalian cell entry related domain protein n=1 Tax=Candidatus Competibacter denitrificans Run_A_D11 TaxID=1400863 RepID=W6ME39_9GAMM|nr:MlaD family protein [Candidatus Competibacter denitrificans]CDI03943.1 putative Mammalian cell entry related domain protein [Candidatus Competibacter denitrificans Run_A_D11]HRC69506.1 MlaD family protein [Candidatus Competibacter denitrificans]
MLSKVNYTLVGLFVVLLGAALLGVVFWLTVGGDAKVYDRYRVYFQESVAGLNLKATVRYRGVQVGQVESIQLNPANPDQVAVILDIERGTPIRRDTIATLSTRGLTGVASVELSGGGAGSPPLEKQANQDLPVIRAGPSLVARLDDAFNNILTNVNNFSNRLEQLLSDDNQKAIAEILRHGSTITGTIAGRADSVDRIVKNVEGFTGELAKRTDRLGKVLDRLATDLEAGGDLVGQARATLTDFRAAAQSVRKTADTFNQTGQDVSGVAQVGRQELRRLGEIGPSVNEILVQANDLVETLRRLAELLEQHPRALLLGKPTGRPGPGEK